MPVKTSQIQRSVVFAYLTVNELNIVWALSITVTSSVLGTSLVGGVLGLPTIGGHLGEVQSTVQTTWEVGDIDIEGEFLVVWLEQLILGISGVHEVDTGTDVGRVWAHGDELESERVASGRDTVGTTVVGTIQSTVCSTGLSIGAESGVPAVTIIAVGAAGGGVEPTPVRVEHNGRRLVGAGSSGAGAGTLGPGELGVGLRGEGTNLLRRNSGGKEDEGQH